MDFEKVLALRRSTRKFEPKAISDDEMAKIVYAAQMAPLAMGNNKSTHLTVVRDIDKVEGLREACALTAKSGKTVDAFYGSRSALFVSVAKVSDDNIEYCDVACVIENMHLAATNLGLGSCYLWGCIRKLNKAADVLARLGLPDGYRILSGFCAGYPAEPLAERGDLENITFNYV